MTANLIAIPILLILVILQSSLVSRMPLLRGTPDLLLLATVAWALQPRVRAAWGWSFLAGLLGWLTSALPLGVTFAGYGISTAIALAIRRRIWKTPFLTMLIGIIAGTLVIHLLSLGALRFTGSPIPLIQAIELVTLPSLLLNLALSIPFYFVFRDLANWLYPAELEA